MTVDEHVQRVVDQIARDDLAQIDALKDWTTNPALLGALAEACVRRLISRVVYPLRVSSGTIVDYPVAENLPQIDAIVWAPFPAPAVFDVGDFAVVPRSSAFGAFEIKRTNYATVNAAGWYNPATWRARLIEAEATIGDTDEASLGVVCILDQAPSNSLQAQIDRHEVVAIFDARGPQAEVRPNDMALLINRLNYVKWRYYSRLVFGPLVLPTT
jgi:hypothetical protein